MLFKWLKGYKKGKKEGNLKEILAVLCRKKYNNLHKKA